MDRRTRKGAWLVAGVLLATTGSGWADTGTSYEGVGSGTAYGNAAGTNYTFGTRGLLGSMWQGSGAWGPGVRLEFADREELFGSSGLSLGASLRSAVTSTFGREDYSVVWVGGSIVSSIFGGTDTYRQDWSYKGEFFNVTVIRIPIWVFSAEMGANAGMSWAGYAQAGRTGLSGQAIVSFQGSVQGTAWVAINLWLVRGGIECTVELLKTAVNGNLGVANWWEVSGGLSAEVLPVTLRAKAFVDLGIDLWFWAYWWRAWEWEFLNVPFGEYKFRRVL